VNNDLEINVFPATAERWEDLESLFGQNGAYDKCWCMFWRLKRAEYSRLRGDGTKALLKEMTCNNEVPGLLAYMADQPIGWCSVGPREKYASLERSRTLKRIDDRPVWSIVCFFVARPYRQKGVLTKLLHGAITYAKQQGAGIIEGYPVDLQSQKLAGQSLHGCSGYMGIASVFSAAGFVKVREASKTQVIMRYVVRKSE
jgi:GNAT superfamily N-acetyltransferase